MSEREADSKFERAGGILLHPTSLPGDYGVGELGPEALRFVEFLAAAGQRLWQILPTGPTGYSNSPYQSYSSFAGNPLLVSTDRLRESGLLHRPEVQEFPEGSVDYEAARHSKMTNLRRAHERFRPPEEYRNFCEENRWWLEDYALFMSLREAYGNRPWTRWEPELRDRDPEALAAAGKSFAAELEFQRFVQYLFFEHFREVRAAANERGIKVLGDLPIFVAPDSADVWANRELFHLDDRGEPTVVAGVPPDYFSETGQRWGNPLYDWERMERAGYDWWVARLRAALDLCDILRVDHFRGFEAYWEIPAQEATAVKGRWVEAPGGRLLQTFRRELGEVPLISEDLGIITPEVERLRDDHGLPGMKVLQFAFSGPQNEYLPHNYPTSNCVVYTGTHDNDTTAGWLNSATAEETALVRRYLGRERPVARDLIEFALASVADLAIFPMQDLLELGSDSRMNLPGSPEGNWDWRLRPDALTPELARELRELTRLYNR